ncbi:MAG TPA: alanine racemase [Alphaproteobacteria bacterium]|nr:alanine racemase [Alphaproteobacteria bacterium]
MQPGIPAQQSSTADGAEIVIDLGAIVANWRSLKGRGGPGTDCAAVVKADGYGLGAGRVAGALYEAGCRSFFVAQFGEAAAIRPLLPADARVAVLGGFTGPAAVYLDAGIQPVLNSIDQLRAWAGAAQRLGRRLPAILHVDTAMSRLGLAPDELAALIADPSPWEWLRLDLVMSHLACGDEPDHGHNAEQLGQFRHALAKLPPAKASLANSAGVLLGPAFHFDLLRPGCGLYGINPRGAGPNAVGNVVSLTAPVLQVRRVDSPMTVGYGAAHRVARPGRVATVAAGYADGYKRSLSGRAEVFLAGRRVPLIGRVSMDLITIDVTDIPEVRPGDRVELIGPHVPVDEVAAWAGTIGYEMLTGIAPRVRRAYVNAPAPTLAC